MPTTGTIATIGEVLWDFYENEKFPGGSPANVAFHLHQMVDKVHLYGRVGSDALGDEMIAHLGSLGVSRLGLQQDPDKPTGSVHVSVDSRGNPSFQCSQDVAFDYLSFDEYGRSLAHSADAIYFTTLGQRCPVAAVAINQFLAEAKKAVKVYDLNLAGWNDRIAETVEFGLQRCDVVKLNQQELKWLHRYYASRMDDISLLRFLINQYDLKLVALTRGAQGCLLLSRHETLEHRGYAVPVKDTAGCGDAFAAIMIVKYLLDASLDEIADQACRLAAFVATQKGAVPRWTSADLATISGEPVENRVTFSDYFGT